MITKCFVLMILALWCCKGVAQIQPYDTDFELSEKKFVIRIPIEIENNQVYVQLAINGQQYRFLLDTGAGQGVIYDDLVFDGVKTLGYTMSRDALGQSHRVKTVEMPLFMIGTLQISGYKVQVMHRHKVQKGEDGIIGFALFNKGIAAKIDVRNSEMIITDKKKYFKQEPGESLDYRLRNFVPVVTVSPFEGMEEDVLFDTGSPFFYAINSQTFEAMEHDNPDITEQVERRTYGSRIKGHYGREPFGRISMLNLKRLKWGSYAFCNLHCATIAGNSHVGAELLKYGAVIINPFKKRLVFQPYNGQDSCVIGNR